MASDPLGQSILGGLPATLLPDTVHAPYYIVVPPYIQTSAGIRSMHLLIHWLNRAGYQAYACIPPSLSRDAVILTNPNLLTPTLDQGTADLHFRAGRKPIVLCSDTFPGTLTNAPFTVRWYGHYSGALTDLKDTEVADMRYGYSLRIARSLGAPENVLCLPVVNTNVFHPGEPIERTVTCYYASKFKAVYGGQTFGLPPGCIEITRDQPDSQTPQEIAALFRRSRYFYCFEDSALILEAGLCGCPAILMKSQYFTNPLGVDDFGWDGFAWGTSPDEIARAEATVGKVATNYAAVVQRFFVQLNDFIAKTQSAVADRPYPAPVEIEAAEINPETAYFRYLGATDVERQLAEALTLLRMVRGSTSWRITEPLRRATIVGRRIMRPRLRGDAQP
jgi:hypothetical protein